jgi:hypothetical protein
MNEAVKDAMISVLTANGFKARGEQDGELWKVRATLRTAEGYPIKRIADVCLAFGEAYDVKAMGYEVLIGPKRVDLPAGFELTSAELLASDLFELYRHPALGWYCRYRCACGSHLSSGVWVPHKGEWTGRAAPHQALAECIESCNHHWATVPTPEKCNGTQI